MLILSALWLLVYASFAWTARAEPTRQAPLVPTDGDSRSVSFKLFAELEELARIVDIAYCVGTTGIQKPFLCASRCQDFTGFELVTVRILHPSTGHSWYRQVLLIHRCL